VILLLLISLGLAAVEIPYPYPPSYPTQLKPEDGAVGSIAADGKLALPDILTARLLPDAKSYRGIEFIFPVAGADFRNIEYSWRTGLSDFRNCYRHNHDGCDIFAKRGTPVLAAADGVVMLSCWAGGRGPGNKVCVYHGNGVFTYYLHMISRKVERGDRVEKGQVIGEVGNAGNARGTPHHLHFEIDPGVEGMCRPTWFVDYINAQPGLSQLRSIDPLPYIIEKTGASQ
jgi:peptidoglycan LD-endopeptidase LytH